MNTRYQCLGGPVGVIVSVGSPIGVPVPPGVGEPDGVTDGVVELVGDGIAVLVGVGDATIAVKKASDVSVHGVTLGMLKVIWISTTWLMALAWMVMEKTASPSLVVVVFSVALVPSGQNTTATADAPLTPTGLPSTVCVYLP